MEMKIDVHEVLRSYFELEKDAKDIEKQLKDKKGILKVYLYEHGTPDAKGSVKMAFDEGKIEDIMRESVKINEERAVALLQRKGFAECLKEILVYEIVESNVEKRASTGDLTSDDMRDMMDVKKTKAFYVKKR